MNELLLSQIGLGLLFGSIVYGLWNKFKSHVNKRKETIS